MMPTSEDIDRQAAEWAARKDLGTLSPEDERAFEAWLAGDPRALGSYCRVEAALFRVERAGGVAKPNLHATDRKEDARFSRRGMFVAGGAAASILAGAFGMAFWNHQRGQRFNTRIGEVREVPLDDGSIVTLNTNSEVAVNYSKELRQIHLLRGEALFDVAKNRARPFIVLAGDAQVRAVGTSFSVSILPQHPIQVLVREGVVELKRADAAARVLPVRVSANMRALSSRSDRIVAASLPQENVKRDLAWQYGQIAFDNETLRDAADEFARYSEVRIIVDPAVGSRTITGLFAASDPIGFAKLAAAALGLHLQVDGGEVRISAEADKNTVGKI
ncbi:MAG TPA: FecR domain-containing protein [Rhizomicrobium sp.]|nr:FecR domain-containing protein [Rhizomicrobium sp.]